MRTGTARAHAFDPGRLSARAALLPKGEVEHALRPQFAVQHLVSGKVGPEHSLLPPYRDSTLTKGLSPLESLESHRQREANSRCHLSQTAPGRIPHLPAYASRGQKPERLRVKPRPLQTAPALVCLSGLVQSSRLTPLTLEAVI